MAKKNFGLESLLQPTTKETKTTTQEKYVNSNFPLKQRLHAELRMLAFKRGISLKELFTQIIEEYLQKNKD